jgi:RNA polymerase sigma-70 factor (ECF subfamily)
MHETSLSLLDRLRRDHDALDWQRFAALYEPLLRHWLRRREVPMHEADDIVQNIMLVVVRRMAEFQHNGRPGAFRTWLRTITANCLRDHWRLQRRAAVGVGGSEMADWIAQLEDSGSQLAAEWEREHDRHVMRQLLITLRPEFEPRTWAAFERFALDGLPAAEVARELQMTPNAVFVAKSRVLARLRQESNGLLEDES